METNEYLVKRCLDMECEIHSLKEDLEHVRMDLALKEQIINGCRLVINDLEEYVFKDAKNLSTDEYVILDMPLSIAFKKDSDDGFKLSQLMEFFELESKDDDEC